MKNSIIILSILIMACGSSSMAVDNLPYEMTFEDFCEVVAIDDIRHTVKCQGQLFVVYYYFEPPDEPLQIGDSVQTEFKFEAIEDEFTLLDLNFIDMSQPQEMGDDDA